MSKKMNNNKALKSSASIERVSRMKIVPFTTNYTEQVISMILDIQQNEFNLPITASDQPDLSDIPNFYQQRDGNFWLAIHDNDVVGTISITDIGNKQVALRKMFVHRDHRGKKIGTAQNLLESLLSWADTKKINNIFLGTTSEMFAAQRFYEKNEFIEINKNELPESFPIMEVDSKFYVHKRNST